MLEAVHVKHAAGRQEVLPTETVKIEGSDWVNFQGLGNDFTNPNWNWFNSQNPATIMDGINQDRSEADGAQEDAMHEELKTIFGGDGKSSLQHSGPISVRPDQMARMMLVKCAHPHHTDDQYLHRQEDCIPRKICISDPGIVPAKWETRECCFERFSARKASNPNGP